MLRYKGQQNLHRQLEQNKLSRGRNLDLRLRTRTENETKLNVMSKTHLKLKRKLLVYKKDGKFYIDHSAAYALKLTNVRAIMTEKSHLMEIGLETLYKLQNNEEFEIEYQEINKENERGTRKDDLRDTLEELEQGEYGIGIHGIDRGNSEVKQSTASNISNNGLNINNNSKTILSTSISLGTNEDTQRVTQDIMGYKFGNGTKANVVIAVPLCIEIENGEKIFLGFPEENKGTSGQQYEEHCILDRICAKIKKVPPEFILGYYCENADGSESFIKNLNHYSNLTQEQREDLYREMSSNMDDISKSYNELIANGNIEQLGQIKEKMQLLGWKSHFADNSISLAQKYNEQAKSTDTKGKKTRRVIITDEQKTSTPLETTRDTRTRKVLLDMPESKTPVETTRGIRTRRILLDTYKDVKSSDLTVARDTLREGMAEQEIENEGKNV